MSAVRSLGGMVRLDPNPERRVASFEHDDGGRAALAEGGDNLLAELDAGKWALGELHCWAMVEDDGGEVERRPTAVVPTIWLRIGDLDATMKHAREMFDMALPAMQVELTRGGVDVPLETLEGMSPEIDCASEVRAL